MTEHPYIYLTALCFAGLGVTLLATLARIVATLVAERLRDAAKRIGGSGTVALAFACVMVLYGGSKQSLTSKTQTAAASDILTTGPIAVRGRDGVPSPSAAGDGTPALPESRGSPLTVSFAAHPFAGEPTLVGKWWRRGAYDDGEVAQDVAVLLGSSLSLEVVAEPSASTIPSVLWHAAKLNADRTYADWRSWGTQRYRVTRTMGESGVFAIKARAMFSGPQWADVQYVWTEDEDPVIGLHRKGMLNHVGVATTQEQLNLRAAARAKLGDTDYAFEATLPARNGFFGLKKNSWKCNAFVADIAIAADLTVPVQYRTGIALLYERCYPPVANDWANGDVKIDGWQFLGRNIDPEPGLILGHPAPAGPGHVGIVDFDGEGIAAGGTEVNRRYRKFLDGASGFNRYIGNQMEQKDE